MNPEPWTMILRIQNPKNEKSRILRKTMVSSNQWFSGWWCSWPCDGRRWPKMVWLIIRIMFIKSTCLIIEVPCVSLKQQCHARFHGMEVLPSHSFPSKILLSSYFSMGWLSCGKVGFYLGAKLSWSNPLLKQTPKLPKEKHCLRLSQMLDPTRKLRMSQLVNLCQC